MSHQTLSGTTVEYLEDIKDSSGISYNWNQAHPKIPDICLQYVFDDGGGRHSTVPLAPSSVGVCKIMGVVMSQSITVSSDLRLNISSS